MIDLHIFPRDSHKLTPIREKSTRKPRPVTQRPGTGDEEKRIGRMARAANPYGERAGIEVDYEWDFCTISLFGINHRQRLDQLIKM